MWFLLLSWKLQLHFKPQDKSHGNKIYLILFNPASPPPPQTHPTFVLITDMFSIAALW